MAGLAAGGGIAAGGLSAYAMGRVMRRDGRAQSRANAGGRGDMVRGGRLMRAGTSDIRGGRDGLAGFKQSKAKNGKTMYFQNGKIAPTGQFTRQISQGEAMKVNGGNLRAAGGAKRKASSAGLKAMSRGRWASRGGLVAAGLGAGLAAASVNSAEKRRSRFIQGRDRGQASGRAGAAATAQADARRQANVNGRGREMDLLRPKGAREGFRNFKENEATGKLVPDATRRQQEWDAAWRKQIGDTEELPTNHFKAVR